MFKQVFTESQEQTKKLAQELAKKLLKKKRKKALVLALKGELGSGKTTFLQGLAKGLKIKEKILSPTFVIMKRFPLPLQGRFFYHIDCYRIQKPKEILELGFEEIIDSPQNIVAVEWAEKIKKFLPPETIWLEFKAKEENKREITINSPFSI